MSFLIPSFFAGVFTVLAPCVLTFLPVILGGSLGEKNMIRPSIIITSLGFSVILFSIALKATTLFISVPNTFWTSISGGILFIFGLTMIFPFAWGKITTFFRIHGDQNALQKNAKEQSMKSAILLGMALGPVFTTCSPTYAVIIAIILPASFTLGIINLFAYTFGLSLILFIIAMGGQTVVRKFHFVANPNGWLKKSLGILLLITGFAIMSGLDKKLESAILDLGYGGPVEIEEAMKSFF